MKFWIVLPTLNDSPSIQAMIPVIKNDLLFAESDAKITFVIVDDSLGKDSGVLSLKSENQELEIQLCLPMKRLGNQEAILFGINSIFRRIGPEDFIVVMDSDGEDSPKDVRRLFTALKNSNADIAIARRKKRHSKRMFLLGKNLYSLILRTLTGYKLETGNFSILRGEWLLRSGMTFFSHGVFASELIANDINRTVVDCVRPPRYDGQTRTNFWSLVQFGVFQLIPFFNIINIRALKSMSLNSLFLMAVYLLAKLHYVANPENSLQLFYTITEKILLATFFGEFILFTYTLHFLVNSRSSKPQQI